MLCVVMQMVKRGNLSFQEKFAMLNVNLIGVLLANSAKLFVLRTPSQLKLYEFSLISPLFIFIFFQLYICYVSHII